jgi:hypothetical protein
MDGQLPELVSFSRKSRKVPGGGGGVGVKGVGAREIKKQGIGVEGKVLGDN